MCSKGYKCPPVLGKELSVCQYIHTNKVYTYKYENCDDTITWKWGGKGQFTTKLVYDHLSKDDNGSHFQHIWKAKLPYKIKIFTWLLENNAILTKDNMIKRKWTGNTYRMFCNQEETIIISSRC
jgi:hypothetical protein